MCNAPPLTRLATGAARWSRSIRQTGAVLAHGQLPELRPDAASRTPARDGVRAAWDALQNDPEHPLAAAALPRVVRARVDLQGRHRRGRVRSRARTDDQGIPAPASSSTSRAPIRTCPTSAAARAAACSRTCCASAATPASPRWVSTSAVELGGGGARRSASARSRRSTFPRRRRRTSRHASEFDRNEPGARVLGHRPAERQRHATADGADRCGHRQSAA